MNPVISAQAHSLVELLNANETAKARFLLEQSHLPYDVQDLIFASLSGLSKYDDQTLEQILEECVCQSSFDERMCH